MIYIGNNRVNLKSLTVPLKEKDVNFYDWEGTLLYSYTKHEALELTALPPLPDRTSENLTCEEWNWTLPDIKQALNEGYPIVAVGCTYHTTDGITYLYANPIELKPGIRLYLKSELSNDTTIDWGDGTIDTVTTTSTSADHTYTSEYFGTDVTIKVTSMSGTHTFMSYFFGYSQADNQNNRIVTVKMSQKARLQSGTSTYVGFVNATFLKYISLSRYNYDGVSSYNGLFHSCRSLWHVNIPSTFVISGTNLFRQCDNLRTASFSQILNAVNYAFTNCWCLEYANPRQSDSTSSTTLMCANCMNIHYPMYVNSSDIGDRTFYSEHSLKVITLSSRVSTMHYRAIDDCPLLEEVYIKATTPPALSGAFTAPNTFYRIYVPRTSLFAYQSASNWSDIASHIYPYDF